jgi:hypothetical protein
VGFDVPVLHRNVRDIAFDWLYFHCALLESC